MSHILAKQITLTSLFAADFALRITLKFSLRQCMTKVTKKKVNIKQNPRTVAQLLTPKNTKATNFKLHHALVTRRRSTRIVLQMTCL